MHKRVGWGTGAFAVLIAVGAAVFLGGTQSEFEPPRRSGPMGLVRFDDAAALWIASTQEEEQSRYLGGGRGSTGRWLTHSYYHLRIQAHDPATAQRQWLSTLKVVKDDDGGRNAQVRILGQEGALVWVWVHDQVLALSARDGGVVADRARLEAADPSLRDLLSGELKHYTWNGQLIATLADGRHVRIGAESWAVSPYQIEDAEQFSRANFMTGTWNGGYRTEEFGLRHGLFDGHWIGLLSDKEARDAEQDEWGDHFANAAEIDDEGQTARRTFWRASTGRTREFSEGSHERLLRLDRIEGAGSYLQGRLLKRTDPPGTPAFILRGRSWRRAPGTLLRVTDPEGVLVLHRTRMDAPGRLALTRLDGAFGERWTAVLPLAELGSRWELAQRLLLFGHWDDAQPGRSDWREALIAVDLADGSWTGWEIGAEAPVPR